jgi:hypothetical protein
VRLRALARAGNDGEIVAAGERLGKAWRARERPPGERKWTRIGRRRHVEKISAGGGAAAAVKRRPEGSATGGRAEQSRTHVREEEEERVEVRGTGL